MKTSFEVEKMTTILPSQVEYRIEFLRNNASSRITRYKQNVDKLAIISQESEENMFRKLSEPFRLKN